MPANSILELNRLTKQLRGIADNNYWTRPKDWIPVTQKDGHRYIWERIIQIHSGRKNRKRDGKKKNAVKLCLLWKGNAR